MNQLNENKKENDFFSTEDIIKLTKIIFKNQKLQYVIYDDKIYFERVNLWSSKNVDKKCPCLEDKDGEKGYWKCNYKYNYYAIYDDSIRPTKEKIYVFDFNDKFLSEKDYDDEDKELKEFFLKRILPNKEKITIKENLIFQNKDGINRDHRGSTHCQLELEFIPIITIKKGTYSFDEISNLLWNLKSHKFENWYELFCDCEYKNNKFILDFDHGS